MSSLKESDANVEERRTDFRVGEWIVQAELNSLTRDKVVRHIEPKVMKVLLTLSAQQGRVVPKEELISAVWPDTFVTDDVLTRCISILPRITEDDPQTPHFIQTIPKCMVRRRTAREKLRSDRQVCGNVFGLSVEIISPGHDEFRCAPVLTSRSVVGDHFRDQVEGTPL
jgi:hypothetical protein